MATKQGKRKDPRSFTTEHWVKKAKTVHDGCPYDYTKVEYLSRRTPITILCTIHGSFSMAAGDHIRGSGCAPCAWKRRSDRRRVVDAERFLEKAKKVHGNRFDYSLTEYKNKRTKVAIICRKHGKFECLPPDHLKYCGCKKCGWGSLTTEEWIEKAKRIHDGKYSYEQVVYKGSQEKVAINCPTHGIFTQRACTHIQGRQGCLRCSNSYSYTTGEWIEKAKEVHGNRYDYSETIYRNAKTPVKIRCRIHGCFEQNPQAHVLLRNGCRKCAGNFPLTTPSWKKKAEQVHGKFYDYSKSEYNGQKEYITIRCPEHGLFQQAAGSHLQGHGCSQCLTFRGEKCMITTIGNLRTQTTLNQRNWKITSHFPKLKLANSSNGPGTALLEADDFVLLLCERNRQVRRCVIERHGEQHDDPTAYFAREFPATQERDRRKIEYCRKNNLDMLIIWYRVPLHMYEPILLHFFSAVAQSSSRIFLQVDFFKEDGLVFVEAE